MDLPSVLAYAPLTLDISTNQVLLVKKTLPKVYIVIFLSKQMV